MANAFDSYLRGKQSAMQQGQQQFAMEQAVQNMQYTQQKRQREQQLQGILAGAYQQPTAAIPAQAEVPQLDAAPAMGALQQGEAPLPDYPSQDSSPAVEAQPATAGGLSMRNALNAMYQGGFGKEALALEAKQAKLGGGIGTYNPRDYTTESWSNFANSRDPSGLVRYETSLQERIANDPTLAALIGLTQADINKKKEKSKLDVKTGGAQELKFKEQLGAAGGKIYTNLQKAAQKASTFIPRLESLKELASKVKTGTGAEIKMVASRALGIESADMEVLNAKLGELAQDILNEQTGTKTDFDFENAVKQSAALGKTPEANAALINALIKRQQQAVNFGNQAKEAYKSSGPKGVLDMRYVAPPAQNKVGQIIKGRDGKSYIIKSLKADGTPDDVMVAR